MKLSIGATRKRLARTLDDKHQLCRVSAREFGANVLFEGSFHGFTVTVLSLLFCRQKQQNNSCGSDSDSESVELGTSDRQPQ